MVEGEVVNRIVVPKQIADDAILALDRMLAIVA
jgi:quinolinate synthase